MIVVAFHINSDHYVALSSRPPASAEASRVGHVFFAVFEYDAVDGRRGVDWTPEAMPTGDHVQPGHLAWSRLRQLACLTLVGIQNSGEIDPAAGFSSRLRERGLAGIGTIIAIGAIIGILTVMFTSMLRHPRPR